MRRQRERRRRDGFLEEDAFAGEPIEIRRLDAVEAVRVNAGGARHEPFGERAVKRRRVEPAAFGDAREGAIELSSIGEGARCVEIEDSLAWAQADRHVELGDGGGGRMPRGERAREVLMRLE